MTIDDLNKILIYLKVKNILNIQYLSVDREISEMVNEGIQLYDFKYNKFMSIDEIKRLAKEAGYPQ
jgi:hypothetical protein|tara:strand:+ start:181 stop:378 length:198 start_codon:yes stop_codon:yes gene_type:complete